MYLSRSAGGFKRSRYRKIKKTQVLWRGSYLRRWLAGNE